MNKRRRFKARRRRKAAKASKPRCECGNLIGSYGAFVFDRACRKCDIPF